MTLANPVASPNPPWLLGFSTGGKSAIGSSPPASAAPCPNSWGILGRERPTRLALMSLPGLAGRAVGLASAPSALADVHTAHSDLIARLRAAEVITLAQITAEGTQEDRLVECFHSLGDDDQIEAVC